MVRYALLIEGVVSLVLLPFALKAGANPAPEQQTDVLAREQQLPPGTIDGSVTPELIPDIVAFRLFFSVACEGPANPSVMPSSGAAAPSHPEISDKQRAIIRPVQLDDNDQDALFTELASFKNNLHAIASRSARTQLQNSSTATPVDEIEQATRTTLNAVRSKMTPDGFQRLETHVQAFKSRSDS